MIQNKINIIKKIITKFDIKIKLNKILKDKIEKKSIQKGIQNYKRKLKN
jgi:hypothetical protein